MDDESAYEALAKRQADEVDQQRFDQYKHFTKQGIQDEINRRKSLSKSEASPDVIKGFTREGIKNEIARRQSKKEPPKTYSQNVYEGFKKKLKNSVREAPRYAGMGARAMTTGALGAVPELAALPFNLGNMALGKLGITEGNTWSPTEKLQEGFDYLTGDQFKPRTPGERVGSAVLESVSPYRAIGKAAQLLPKGVQAISNLFPSTKAAQAAAGAAGGTQQYLTEKGHPIAGMIIGTGLGMGAHKAARQSMNPAKLWRSTEDARAKAALRSDPIAKQYVESLPERYGAPSLTENPRERAGELAVKGATDYYEKAQPIFKKMKEKAKSYLTPETEMMSVGPATEWSLGKLSELRSPEARKLYMDSKLGHETIRLLGLPEGTSYEGLMEAVKKNPGILKRKIPFAELDLFKRHINDIVGDKGFSQIGPVSKGELEKLSGLLSNQISEGFRNISPEAFHHWQRYNKSYSNYAKTKKPLINQVWAEQNLPERAYHASAADKKVGGQAHKFLLENLRGDEKQDFARTLTADLGWNGKKFDAKTFHKEFYNLDEPLREAYLKALPPKESENMRKALNLMESYYTIRSQDKTLADIPYRTPALSIEQYIKKTLSRAAFGSAWKTPQGHKKIDKALLAVEKPSLVPQETAWEFAKKAAPRSTAQVLRNTDKLLGTISGS